MLLDARTAARAWLSTALVTGTDKLDPQLYRTTLVEMWLHGIRLTCTDARTVLTVWVPDIGHDPIDHPEPELGETPPTWIIARDPHQRGAGLWKHLAKLPVAESEDPPQVRVTILATDPNGSGGRLPMDDNRRWLKLEHPSHEMVLLEHYDGSFPAWRPILLSHAPRPATGVELPPDVIAKLGKLADINGPLPIVWEFGGPKRPARILFDSGDLRIDGMFLPVSVAEADAKVIESDGATPLPVVIPDVEQPIEEIGQDVVDLGDGILTSDGYTSYAELFRRARRMVVESQVGASTMLCRRLGIGFALAVKLADQLTDAGILGPSRGSQARDVLVGPEALDAIEAAETAAEPAADDPELADTEPTGEPDEPEAPEADAA